MKMTDLTALLHEKRKAAGSDTPLRVVICGEVSAGKSTVMNALMRSHLLPDNIGRSERPVLVAGWRDIPGIEAVGRHGHEMRAALPGTPALFHQTEFVRLWLDQPHLAGIELIELPMTKAEELTDEQIALVNSADVMIWVTIGSQAWRLTEKAIVEALGDARPDRSILVVSRGDKLRSDKDRGRLMERMERETNALFAHRMYLYGERRRIAASADSDAEWEESGGAGLAALLSTFATRPERTVYEGEARRDWPEADEPAAEDDLAPAGEAEAEPEETADIAFEPEAQAEEIVNEAQAAARAQAGAEEIQDEDIAGEDTADENTGPEIVEEAEAGEAVAEPTEAAAEPEAEPVPEPGPEAAKPAPVLPGLLQAGLLPENDAGLTTLAGDEATVAQLAGFCSTMLTQLEDERLTTSGGPVSFFSLATGRRRVLFQIVSGKGMVFLLADAQVMNQGMAQMAIGQLCADKRVTG
ncbi:hypothetical protein [Pseudogemmobacter bohemicus]|uniref:hypothetical protein n=1 Tax=Pseudogemmobacter bohemicus TaxID=2250708 RepID=UPI000DD48BEF|nr:hypothetical protein [Pseudogemmobacter bohemicus]